MRPADIAISLRRRTPWEAMDLGFSMLRRWWKPVYAAHAIAFWPLAGAALLAGWALDLLWVSMLVIWWLEPLYDRVALHVLSRAVFGEVAAIGFLKRPSEYWAGLIGALTFGRFDFARSFNLPVRQLEGSRGRDARARMGVLGRRTRSYAVWLTIVWLHFEAVVLWSAGAAASLLLPAQSERARGGDNTFLAQVLEAVQQSSVEDAITYAVVIFLLEPFYVAAGFALYLNRRTLLEGWDIEVALRRLAERHAAALVLVFAAFSFVAFPADAQDKSPKAQIAEVLKAKEFGYEREVERWRPKIEASEKVDPRDLTWLVALGQALAKAAEVLLWIAAGAILAYALWWAARMLPRPGAAAPEEPYRPPAALFGMELAPETLPPDVGAAAAALARAGKLREALALLYRGALSELVHKRGVQLLASHTEGEVVGFTNQKSPEVTPFMQSLVAAWRACAYAKRMPTSADVEQLAAGYRETFA